jgi:hypothetical protein
MKDTRMDGLKTFLRKECNQLRHLYDIDGRYTKTVCRVNQPLTFDESIQHCSSLLHDNTIMELFVVDTKADWDSLVGVLDRLFPLSRSVNYRLWLNGRESGTANDWWAVLSDNTRLYSGMNVAARRGKCLSVSSEGHLFQVMGSDCEFQMNAICEFRGPEELLTFEI